MKYVLITLLLALLTPAFADRQLTVTWDKYPEDAEIVIKHGEKELGIIKVDPRNPALESLTVTIPDGKVTLVAIARNVGVYGVIALGFTKSLSVWKTRGSFQHGTTTPV